MKKNFVTKLLLMLVFVCITFFCLTGCGGDNNATGNNHNNVQNVKPTEGVVYDISSDGTFAEVIEYVGASREVVIAETYQGLPVRSIYKSVFYKKNLTSVTIPNSVTSIGEWAFNDCTSLTSVVIGDSVTSIGDYSFSNCTT